MEEGTNYEDNINKVNIGKGNKSKERMSEGKCVIEQGEEKYVK